jgi:hypothetical protein
MRGKYFVDFMGSFALGNPDIVEDWKQLGKDAEAAQEQLVILKLPQRESSELIIMIEKLLRDKLERK